jgi:type I restriction enzyme S subunit
MEVKPGYKQTEVGVIPEEWDDPQLADIVKDDSPICYGIVQVGSYARNGIPVLAIKNLNSDYATNIHRASVEIERPYARSRIRPDDVVISVKGTTGRIGIVPTGFHGNISRDLARLRLREGTVPKFCFQMLQSDLAQRRLAVAVVGTTRMELSIAILKKVRIPLPPTKAEQEAIAEALSDADALIESMEQLIAKKRDVKQGAMRELLTGKRRLPGFSGEWEVRRLGNVCRITTGKKDVNEGNPNGQFPFFTCSRSHTFSDSYSFDLEAILIAGNGDVGNLHYFKGKFEAYQRTYVLSEFTANVSYLWQQLSAFLAEALGLGKIGSSIPYIKKENLVGFEFDSPKDEAEQTAIATILSDMDAEIAALEAKLDKARQIKQGMMHNLLTGRIRLVGGA